MSEILLRRFNGIGVKWLSASLFKSLLYVNLLLEPGANQTDPASLHLATQFQAVMGGGRCWMGEGDELEGLLMVWCAFIDC